MFQDVLTSAETLFWTGARGRQPVTLIEREVHTGNICFGIQGVWSERSETHVP